MLGPTGCISALDDSLCLRSKSQLDVLKSAAKFMQQLYQLLPSVKVRLCQVAAGTESIRNVFPSEDAVLVKLSSKFLDLPAPLPSIQHRHKARLVVSTREAPFPPLRRS
jgi:hypothetical protein